ncbi:palindromic element RPE4 domain-containing protein [Rickettsia sp. R2]
MQKLRKVILSFLLDPVVKPRDDNEGLTTISSRFLKK